MEADDFIRGDAAPFRERGKQLSSAPSSWGHGANGENLSSRDHATKHRCEVSEEDARRDDCVAATTLDREQSHSGLDQRDKHAFVVDHLPVASNQHTKVCPALRVDKVVVLELRQGRVDLADPAEFDLWEPGRDGLEDRLGEVVVERNSAGHVSGGELVFEFEGLPQSGGVLVGIERPDLVE